MDETIADEQAWTRVGTRELTQAERALVERLNGSWARQHRLGSCMGRTLALVMTCFALFYLGPRYSWWGAGLILLIAIMALVAAAASAEAGRSRPANSVVIVRARCHTVRQLVDDITVSDQWVGPIPVFCEEALLQRWPEGQVLDVELCGLGVDGALTSAAVVHLPGVSPARFKRPASG